VPAGTNTCARLLVLPSHLDRLRLLQEGRTALHIAVREGNKEVVAQLLAAGAATDATDKEVTPAPRTGSHSLTGRHLDIKRGCRTPAIRVERWGRRKQQLPLQWLMACGLRKHTRITRSITRLTRGVNDGVGRRRWARIRWNG
jgi:hypothetical protein